MLAQTVLMDDTREDILAHTTFAGDKDGKIGGSYLDGLVESHEELGVIANDVVSLFESLDVHLFLVFLV